MSYPWVTRVGKYLKLVVERGETRHVYEYFKSFINIYWSYVVMPALCHRKYSKYKFNQYSSEGDIGDTVPEIRSIFEGGTEYTMYSGIGYCHPIRTVPFMTTSTGLYVDCLFKLGRALLSYSPDNNVATETQVC